MLFYLPKVTSLEENGKIRSYLPEIKFIVLLYAYSTSHFVLHNFLSTFMIIFFILVDTLFTQCALKCATQVMS